MEWWQQVGLPSNPWPFIPINPATGWPYGFTPGSFPAVPPMPPSANPGSGGYGQPYTLGDVNPPVNFKPVPNPPYTGPEPKPGFEGGGPDKPQGPTPPSGISNQTGNNPTTITLPSGMIIYVNPVTGEITIINPGTGNAAQVAPPALPEPPPGMATPLPAVPPAGSFPSTTAPTPGAAAVNPGGGPINLGIIGSVGIFQLGNGGIRPPGAAAGSIIPGYAPGVRPSGGGSDYWKPFRPSGGPEPIGLLGRPNPAWRPSAGDMGFKPGDFGWWYVMPSTNWWGGKPSPGQVVPIYPPATPGGIWIVAADPPGGGSAFVPGDPATGRPPIIYAGPNYKPSPKPPGSWVQIAVTAGGVGIGGSSSGGGGQVVPNP